MKWILVILVISISSQKTVALGKKNPHSLKKQQNQHANISKLLDRLLENYVNIFVNWTSIMEKSFSVFT